MKSFCLHLMMIRRKCPWSRGGENKGSPGALNWRVNDAGGQEDELGAFVSAAFDACPSDKTPLRRHELHALAVVAAAHLRDTAVPLVPHCRIRGWRSVGHQRWGTTASDTAPPVHGRCCHCRTRWSASSTPNFLLRLFGFSYMGTHVNVETWFRVGHNHPDRA